MIPITIVMNSPEPAEMLFTDEILSRISTNLIGKLFDKQRLLLETKIIMRNAFFNQASMRGLDFYGLNELINKIEIVIDQSSVTLNASQNLRNEIDRHLGNKICYICGTKILYAHHHSRDECNNALVNHVMDE